MNISSKELQDNIIRIIESDPRYPPEVYEFINEAVVYTTGKLHHGKKPRHISAEQLLNGIIEYAKEQFGPIAGEVFREWNLDKVDAIGDIVFNMIKENILITNSDDNIKDFYNNFDFEKLFSPPYEHDSDLSSTEQIPKLD